MALERHPQQYGVTIGENRKDDFRIAFDFNVGSGLSYSEARALASEAMEGIGRQFEGNEVLGKLTHYYLLPYLAHYQAIDPSLKTINQKKSPAAAIPERTLNRRSVPRIKQGLTVEQINFNLLAIRQGFAAGGRVSLANRIPTTMVFDPDTNKMSSIPDQAAEVLSLCDGKHNVKEIALALSRKYDAPA